MSRWHPSAIDRYLFRHAGWRMLAIVAVVLVIMTLENAPRLTADLSQADAPGVLLMRLSFDLLPEHLSIALPVATLLAVAMTVRALAGRGEWQMLAAAGMSPSRALAPLFVLAALAAAALLVNGLALRPLGERRLDALYTELAAGGHGVPVPLREPVALDARTLLIADGAGAVSGELRGVLVRRGAATLSAQSARVAADGIGGIALMLGPGATIERLPDGSVRRVQFAGLTLRGAAPGAGLRLSNLRHRLDRQDGGGLWRLARVGRTTTLRDAALAALLARIEAVGFCLLLPWLAVATGVPPRRRGGGPALLVGIMIVVLHMQTAAAVEDGLAAQAIIATLVHAALWTAAVAGISLHVRRRGDGALDMAIVGLARGICERLSSTLRPVRRRSRSPGGEHAAGSRPALTGPSSVRFGAAGGVW